MDFSREEIQLRRHLPANVPAANANFRIRVCISDFVG
jgi:hypothetical protein